MNRPYETPELVQLGEVTDLTQGQGIAGTADSIRLTGIGKYGQEISTDISYGVSG